MASSLNYGLPDTILDVQMDQATLIANTGFELVAPVDGFIKEFRSAVQAAVTTGGTITVFINTVQVVGMTQTIANGAAKGSRATPAVPSAASSKANRTVVKGDRIEIRTAGFATAGSLFGTLNIEAATKSNEPGYAA